MKSHPGKIVSKPFAFKEGKENPGPDNTETKWAQGNRKKAFVQSLLSLALFLRRGLPHPSQDGPNASLAGAPYLQSGHRDGAEEHGPVRSHQLSKK